MSYPTYSQVGGSGTGGTVWRCGRVVELHSVEVNAVPSNKGMEPTVKSVTPFAYAKAAPLSPAAHPRR